MRQREKYVIAFFRYGERKRQSEKEKKKEREKERK